MSDDWKEVLVTLRYRESVLVPGGEMNCEPENADELVTEIDRMVNGAFFGGRVELSLAPPPAVDVDALVKWAKEAARRLVRGRDDTNPGTDPHHGRAVIELLPPPDPKLQAERQANIDRLPALRAAQDRIKADLEAIEFPWKAPGPGMYSSDTPAGPTKVEFAGHTILFAPTAEMGFDSMRTRVRVECLTCREIIHEATTGARLLAKQHWKGVLREAQ